MIVVDANLLVYAHVTSYVRHVGAREWLERQLPLRVEVLGPLACSSRASRSRCAGRSGVRCSRCWRWRRGGRCRSTNSSTRCGHPRCRSRAARPCTATCPGCAGTWAPRLHDWRHSKAATGWRWAATIWTWRGPVRSSRRDGPTPIRTRPPRMRCCVRPMRSGGARCWPTCTRSRRWPRRWWSSCTVT